MAFFFSHCALATQYIAKSFRNATRRRSTHRKNSHATVNVHNTNSIHIISTKSPPQLDIQVIATPSGKSATSIMTEILTPKSPTIATRTHAYTAPTGKTNRSRIENTILITLASDNNGRETRYDLRILIYLPW